MNNYRSDRCSASPITRRGLLLTVLSICCVLAGTAPAPPANAQEIRAFFGPTHPATPSEGTLLLPPDMTVSRVFRWRSSDAIVGEVDTGSVQATTWSPQGVGPARIVFRGSGGGVVVSGDVLLGDYNRGVVDVARGSTRVRYLVTSVRVALVDSSNAEIDRINPISADLFAKSLAQENSPAGHIGVVSNLNPFRLEITLAGDPSVQTADTISVRFVRNADNASSTRSLTETGADTRVFQDDPTSPTITLSFPDIEPITPTRFDGFTARVSGTALGLTYQGDKSLYETGRDTRIFKEVSVGGTITAQGVFAPNLPDTITLDLTTITGSRISAALTETGSDTRIFTNPDQTITFGPVLVFSFFDEEPGFHSDAFDVLFGMLSATAGGLGLSQEPFIATETDLGALAFASVVPQNIPYIEEGLGAEYVPPLSDLLDGVIVKQYWGRVWSASAHAGEQAHLFSTDEAGNVLDDVRVPLVADGPFVFKTEKPILTYGGTLTPEVATLFAQSHILLREQTAHLVYASMEKQAGLIVLTAVGDSGTAGFANGTLVEQYQIDCYPSQVAKQIGITFGLPLITAPGIPAGQARLELKDRNNKQLVLSDKAPAPGERKNASNQNVHNFAVPGATVQDVLKTKERAGGGTAPLFGVILQNKGTEVEQARAKQPELIFVWAGINDYLGIITTPPYGEIVEGVDGNLTTVADYRRDFQALIAALSAPYADGPRKGKKPDLIVANLPDISVFPHLIPLGARLPRLPFGIKNPAVKFGEFAGGAQHLTKENLEKIELPLLVYSAARFHPDGTKVSLSALLSPDVPFNGALFPDLKRGIRMFGDEHVLVPEELTRISDRITAYNGVISTVCGDAGIPVVDVAETLRAIQANGGITLQTRTGMKTVTTDFGGGVVSYDGIHPTKTGYALIANAFIAAINNTLQNRDFGGMRKGTMIKPIDFTKIDLKEFDPLVP